MKISSTQILQIIEQYLKQENLIKTLECLQTESGVILDAQSTILKKNIEKGNWMEVMDGLMYVDLPPKLLATLYEQMILELVESGNIESAAELFHNSEPIEYLENHNESRFAQIKLLMNRFDSKLAYGNRTPIQIRKTLAKDLESILEPPSDDDRLLTLVGQALEYQMGVGKINRSSHYDAYLDKVLDQGETPISPVCNLEHQTKFAKKENPEAAAFSPNGKFFCIGTFDGFLEVWDHESGTMRTDLSYQNDRSSMMVVDSCCLCLSFSRCSRYLVAGDVKGSITVWDIATGKRLDSFVGAHSKGVTSVEFNQDSSLVLSTSFDYSITAHGRKSGALLKSFRGHTSYCNRAKFSEDNTKIISGSSDGTVKIWNYATTECLKTLAFQDGKIILQAFNAPAIHSLLSVPGLDNHFVIISNSRHAYMVNMDGAIVTVYNTTSHTKPKGTLSQVYLCGTLSKSFLYLGTQDCRIECFDLKKGNLISEIITSDGELLGMQCHPSENYLVVYTERRKLSFWTGKD